MPNQKTKVAIYWCRRDFRLTDNRALTEALAICEAQNIILMPLYILDDKLLGVDSWNIGHNRRYFLSQVLAHFAFQFEHLNILIGKTDEIFTKLAQEFELNIFVNDDIEPYSRIRDKKINQIVTDNQGQFQSFTDQLTIDDELVSGSGNVYSVFSPYRNAGFENFLQAQVFEKVDTDKLKHFNQLSLKDSKLQDFCGRNFRALNNSKDINSLQKQIFGLIDKLNVLFIKNPTDTVSIDIDSLVPRTNIDKYWYYNETQALEHFQNYVDTKLINYKEARDNLGWDVDETNDFVNDSIVGGQTSRMSAAFKWGLVSARTAKQMILKKFGREQALANQNIYHYLSELIWREFYRYTLWHRPNLLDVEFQAKYQNDTIQWLYGDQALARFQAWVKGQTGYPVVDACMNQINKMGWMHNRGRMIVASILTKNLGINWRWGQEYFRIMLVDLDEASNNGGWQWASSVGADPKPIRIFNPYTQAENYDKAQKYQSKWLPTDYNHKKPPLIEHKIAREEALKRYKLNIQKNSIRDF